MARLDIDKILRRARQAEKKFEKLNKEFEATPQPKSSAGSKLPSLPKFSFPKISLPKPRIDVRKFWNIVMPRETKQGKPVQEPKLFAKENKSIETKSLPPVVKLLPGIKPSKQPVLPWVGWQVFKQKFQEAVHQKWIVGLVLIVLVVILVPFIAFNFAGTNCERDIACFGSLANQCKSARYTGVIAGASVHVVSRNCQVIKTVVSLPDIEPESVKQLFVGKSMTCTYEQGDFDSIYLTKLTGNLPTCTGDLVTAIQTLTTG